MRHAFITAGTKGLGVQVTEALLVKGYSVTVTFRSDKETVKMLSKRVGYNMLTVSNLFKRM